jgi:hypothetical protein
MADNVIDYGQYGSGISQGNVGYGTPKSTTKTKKTTTKEFDKNGKVVKETIVEETTTETSQYYPVTWTTNSSPGVMNVKYGRSASTELPLE